MLIGCIAGATRTLGKPENWDDERDGKCAGLPILDAQMPDGQAVMISAWQPTPEDLKVLQQGGSVYLWVFGRSHPVVAMGTTPPL